MGTNYYVDISPRFKSTEKQRMHIGKSSFGWEFNFRAYDKELHPKINKNLKSWSDWKQHIEHIGFVINEYGTMLSDEEFFELVENSRKPFRHNLTYDMITPTNHYDYLKIHHPYDIEHGKEWKDDEGWAFSTREFS